LSWHPHMSVSCQVSASASHYFHSSQRNSVIAVASESQQDGERLQPTNDEEECQGNVIKQRTQHGCCQPSCSTLWPLWQAQQPVIHLAHEHCVGTGELHRFGRVCACACVLDEKERATCAMCRCTHALTHVHAHDTPLCKCATIERVLNYVVHGSSSSSFARRHCHRHHRCCCCSHGSRKTHHRWGWLAQRGRDTLFSKKTRFSRLFDILTDSMEIRK
jgi:hypothetical protein